jgi:hypothetical protein
MVTGSSKNSSYGANSVSCAWVIKKLSEVVLLQEETTSVLDNICYLHFLPLLLQGTDETLSRTAWRRTCLPGLWCTSVLNDTAVETSRMALTLFFDINDAVSFSN